MPMPNSCPWSNRNRPLMILNVLGGDLYYGGPHLAILRHHFKLCSGVHMIAESAACKALTFYTISLALFISYYNAIIHPLKSIFLFTLLFKYQFLESSVIGRSPAVFPKTSLPKTPLNTASIMIFQNRVLLMLV